MKVSGKIVKILHLGHDLARWTLVVNGWRRRSFLAGIRFQAGQAKGVLTRQHFRGIQPPPTQSTDH